MSGSRTYSLDRAKRALDRFLGGFVAALMALAVANVLWQVFTRFVLRDPSTFTEELSRFLLIWIGVLGAAYAAGQRAHLALDLLPLRLQGRSGAWLGVFIEACMLVFAVAVLGLGGMRLIYIQLALGQTSAALGVPMGLVYAVLPLSGLVAGFYALVFIVRHLQALRSTDLPLSR